MFSFLNNIPPVTKNLLILNVLVFILTIFFQSQGVDLYSKLGSHYVVSPLFEPYQIITHFFVHDGFFHLLLNMLFFVMLGSHIEREWGAARFFIFYVACSVGAFAIYNAIGVMEIMNLKQQLAQAGFDIAEINFRMQDGLKPIDNPYHIQSVIDAYYDKCTTVGIGASSSVYGVMAAFAILFPNVQFMIYFLFPVRAWVLICLYIGIEVVKTLRPEMGDPVGHLSHVGGALTGAILTLIWRRNSRRYY